MKDKTYELVGLRDDTFKNTDNAEFSRVITTSLDPVPDYAIACLDIGGKSLGVIYVSPHDHRPVVATKTMNKGLVEGAIYFRYVGESKPIKPGELRQIIAHREQRAVAEFARSMTRVAFGSSATLDLNTGEVKGAQGAFVIDKDLLPKIQFIREGDFTEAKGAPTLRLLGDVRPAGYSESEPSVVIRKNVTDDAVLRTFLEQTAVMYPIDYLQRSCHTQRHWLPLFYYMKMAGLTIEQTVAVLEAEDTPYPKICEAAIKRLKGTISAFREPTGAGKKMVAAIQARSFPDPKDLKEAATAAHAIGGLNDVASILPGCLTILTKCLSFAKASSTGSLRSQIYRAACRLDELVFKPMVAGTTQTK